MKKTLVTAILGLATVTSVFSQGQILLDTYNTSGPYITYGTNNVNGASGGTVGEGVVGFNVSLYYLVGNTQVGNINAAFNGTGYDTPTLMTLANPLDAGAVAVIDGSYGPGAFANVASYLIPGTQTADPYQVTLVMLAYNGSTYADSTIRGHSAAFTMGAVIAGTAPAVGGAMPGFSVYNAVLVPEPSTFALAGLGLAGLVIFRRRK